MAVSKNFVVKNGLEVNSNLIYADATNSKVGIASTGPNTTLDVRGGIGATDLNITGVATIATLDWTPVNFSATAITAENLNITGVATFTDLSYDEITGRNLNITGVSTLAVGIVSSFAANNVNVGGISTLNNAHIGVAVTINQSGIHATGVLTATTLYGDGSNISNLPSASPAGSDTQVQYNNSDSFAGTALLTISGGNVTAGTAFTIGAYGAHTHAGVITASNFVGDITGDVTGDVTGNVQGNVTGNLTGELIGAAVTTGAYGLHATGIVTATGGAVVSGALTATTAIVGSAVSISADALDGGVSVRILGENLKVAGVATAQDFNSLSDVVLKENITTVESALDKVSQLRGVKFDWKESGLPSYGVIAQELEEVLPELVHGTDPRTVNYNGIIGVLIEAVKELTAEVERLKE